MFMTKAIKAWREGTSYSRIMLVKQYFTSIEGFTTPQVLKEVKKEKLEQSERTTTKVADDRNYGTNNWRENLSGDMLTRGRALSDMLLRDLKKAFNLVVSGEDPFFAVISYKEE